MLPTRHRFLLAVLKEPRQRDERTWQQELRHRMTHTTTHLGDPTRVWGYWYPPGRQSCSECGDPPRRRSGCPRQRTIRAALHLQEHSLVHPPTGQHRGKHTTRKKRKKRKRKHTAPSSRRLEKRRKKEEGTKRERATTRGYLPVERREVPRLGLEGGRQALRSSCPDNSPSANAVVPISWDLCLGSR